MISFTKTQTKSFFRFYKNVNGVGSEANEPAPSSIFYQSIIIGLYNGHGVSGREMWAGQLSKKILCPGQLGYPEIARPLGRFYAIVIPIYLCLNYFTIPLTNFGKYFRIRQFLFLLQNLCCGQRSEPACSHLYLLMSFIIISAV